MKQGLRIRMAIALICYPFLMLCSYAEGSARNTPARSFSALLVEYSTQNPQLQTKSLVEMGEGGVRMTKLSPDRRKPQFVYIHNFQSHKEWVASPRKMYYAELPLTEDDTDAGQKGVANAPVGVLSTEPCVGMSGEKVAEREVEGTELTVWECKSKDNGESYLQFYSSLVGLVIRESSSVGYTSELQNIKLAAHGSISFIPSKLWRKVSLEEFFSGAPSLPGYQENR